MGNCLALPSARSQGRHHPNTAANNQHESIQLITASSNSTSLECSSHTTRAIDEDEFPNGRIMDAANLRVLTLAELKAATGKFSRDRVIGEGDVGNLYYKGRLKKGAPRQTGEELTIAIKKFGSYGFRIDPEWQSELNFLGRLSHPNLVKLLGYGRQGEELFLVYEYMHRGSLDNHLYGSASVQPLSWDTRLKVMIGVARALAFLHSLDKENIYRILKPTNILLDMTYTAKLSDFGLARFGPSTNEAALMGVRSCCYSAPEHMMTGHYNVKSDVFGFGIILVEMLTGKPIFHIRRPSVQSSFDWIKTNLLDTTKMGSVMDARLEGTYPPNLAFQVAQLAYKCTTEQPKARPSMKEIVETLEQIEATNENPGVDKRRATHSQAIQLSG